MLSFPCDSLVTVNKSSFSLRVLSTSKFSATQARTRKRLHVTISTAQNPGGAVVESAKGQGPEISQSKAKD